MNDSPPEHAGSRPERPGDPGDPSGDLLEDLLGQVLAQAARLEGLGAAQAEAWGSDVLALAIETSGGIEPLVDALRERASEQREAAVALAAIAAVSPAGAVPVLDAADLDGSDLDGSVLDASDLDGSFLAALGTSRCDGGWLLRVGAARSVALRFVDAVDERHVLSADLVPGAPGEPEQLGEVAVGPGDLLDAVDEEDAAIELVEEAGGPEALARRVADALRATTRPRASAVVNGHLLVRRLATILGDAPPPPVAADDEVPVLPERDPDDDAYARDVLRGALRLPAVGDSPRLDLADEADDRASVLADLADLADLVAPASLDGFSPAEQDAVRILEWADWLGAVLGFVRAGAGSPVDGEIAVDRVNRCPEVASTIPKADRARIAWAFDVVVLTWEELGVVTDGQLTDAGVALLPAALDLAWSRSAPT